MLRVEAGDIGLQEQEHRVILPTTILELKDRLDSHRMTLARGNRAASGKMAEEPAVEPAGAAHIPAVVGKAEHIDVLRVDAGTAPGAPGVTAAEVSHGVHGPVGIHAQRYGRA
jgi:hypothetical protein